jgi:hypothetical protein
MIPDYIEEEIDILSDSVLEICEKAAYKAHGGTYVEALWDASPSTILSPINRPEDWQPLELRFHAGDIKFSYNPEVSDVEEYCKASGLEPFYGYQSEPPIAPVFREAKPVGLATPALQSLGILHALLEFEERTDEIPDLNRIFCEMWGANESELQNSRYLKPEITNRSQLDLIKSLRSKSHQIYGYENEQNYVSVYGGGYTHSSLNQKRYLDWHRIYLVMRYIGLNLLVSDPLGKQLLWNRNETLLFGLSAREFPLVTNSPHMPSFSGVHMKTPDVYLTEAMEYSFAYYSSERILEAVADRNRLAQEKVTIPFDLQVQDVTIATLKEALRKDRKGMILSFEAKKEVSYDIVKPSDDTIKHTFLGQVSKLDIHQTISVMRACELVLSSHLLRKWVGKESVNIRKIMDMSALMTRLTDMQRGELKRLIVSFFGYHFGTMTWLLLKKFRQDESAAEIEFIQFCFNMCEDEQIFIPKELSKRELFWSAICHPASLKHVANIFRRTYSKVVHLYNVPNLPLANLSTNLNPHEELLGIMSHLWSKKKTYWLGHYIARKEQLIGWVKDNPKDLSEQGKTQRFKLLRYQWLTKWIPPYACEVKGDFEIWPTIENGKALALIRSTIAAFCRKRKDEIPEILPTENFKSVLRMIDKKFKPRISFLKLHENIHSTMKEMSRDIAKTFRNIFEHTSIAETKDPLGTLWQESLARDMASEKLWVEYSMGLLGEVNLEEFTDEDIFPIQHLLKSETQKTLTHLAGNPFITHSVTPVVDETEDAAAFDMSDPTGDLKDLQKETELFDFGMPNDLEEEGFADFCAEEDEVESLLGYRSPIAEMQDKHGRVPNLVKWAEYANIEVSTLNRCPDYSYERIMSVGLSLFRAESTEEKEIERVAEYDIT